MAASQESSQASTRVPETAGAPAAPPAEQQQENPTADGRPSAEGPRRSRAISAASALLRPVDLSSHPAPPPAAPAADSSDEEAKKAEARAQAAADRTAYQYGDGRIKIEHPGMGQRLQTFHPHHIRDIRRKNDMLKTDVEKAVEGEAGLKPNEEGKIVLTQRAGYLATAYGFSTKKKWFTLVLTGMIQISMK